MQTGNSILIETEQSYVHLHSFKSYTSEYI